jgi:electron transport complex protein RnfB
MRESESGLRELPDIFLRQSSDPTGIQGENKRMINAIIMMLVVGGLLGLLLGVAGSFFTVEVDNRLEEVTAMLPGLNCGACGYPGCVGLAQALVDGKAQPVLCKPSKPAQRDAITAYLAAQKEGHAVAHAHS